MRKNETKQNELKNIPYRLDPIISINIGLFFIFFFFFAILKNNYIILFSYFTYFNFSGFCR